MLRIPVIIMVFMLFVLKGNCQKNTKFDKTNRWEISIMAGTTSYGGDLMPEDYPVFKNPDPAVSAYIKFNLRPASFRFNVLYGQVSGSDAEYGKTISAKMRNLSFRSKIVEFSAIAELNLLRYKFSVKSNPVTPYLLFGFGRFYFNPQTLYNGQWIDLQPLGTERWYKDQPYPLNDFVLVYGAGIKINIFRRWNIGYEISPRNCNTDYLDDVSTVYPNYSKMTPLAIALADRSYEVNNGVNYYHTGQIRGNPQKDDMYFFAGFTVSYNFKWYKQTCYLSF